MYVSQNVILKSDFGVLKKINIFFVYLQGTLSPAPPTNCRTEKKNKNQLSLFGQGWELFIQSRS